MYGHKVEVAGKPGLCFTDTDSSGIYAIDIWGWG